LLPNKEGIPLVTSFYPLGLLNIARKFTNLEIYDEEMLPWPIK
jgi:hypothetical protein